MNVLRLIVAEKEKKSRPPNPEFQKIEAAAASTCITKDGFTVQYDKDELRKKLSPVEYFVTQERGTERPFSGKFLQETADGVYTCVVCEHVLFRSDQKFKSECGWPSFSDVEANGTVIFTKDTSNGMQRIEVSCSRCGSHLGHIFDDGPRPNKLRYCINSASLGFKRRAPSLAPENDK